MMNNQKSRVVNSALWAAYADSLGFITELTDESGLVRRLKGEPFSRTVSWKRQIGGKFGAYADLPAGCYSDDTQLRLATSRCIRGDGYFDVEAFAKVELPVWLSYALGAGRGTKAAASRLSGKTVSWFSNFDLRQPDVYFGGGGNGAVMRIQPHVWASRIDSDRATLVLDVFKNTICTHGHMRAISGAVFHALCLAYTAQYGEVAEPDDWPSFVGQLSLLSELVVADTDISTFWLPTWERYSETSFSAALEIAQEELLRDIEIITASLEKGSSASYENAVKMIGGLDPKTRGAGTKTALLGSALSWAFQDAGAEKAVLVGTGLLGSDTDTVTTLTGAILGFVEEAAPEGSLQDREYIAQEAERVHGISLGDSASSFEYPDLLKWIPPKNQMDAMGHQSGTPCLAGLGVLEFEGEIIPARSGDGSGWQWARLLKTGQSVLCKRREQLKTMPLSQLARSAFFKPGAEIPSSFEGRGVPKRAELNSDLFQRSDSEKMQATQIDISALTIEEMTNEVIKSGFNPTLIGTHLLAIAERNSEVELGIAYSAIVLKARKARLKRADGS